MAANQGYAAVFDRLFQQGRGAVMSGAHYRDTPPVEGGRWGLSVAFVPGVAAMRRLEATTFEAMRLAGGGHWPTGAPEAVHFTVRAIQVYRSAVPVDDPLATRCGAALRRAAAQARPVPLRLDGLTLTPSGVMACAFPVDGAADEFAVRLGDELGADGWFEADYRRDIWYASLVHFTEDIPDPYSLVDWVAARRHVDLGVMTADEAQLLRFRFNGRQPVRVPIASAPIGGMPAPTEIRSRAGEWGRLARPHSRESYG